jgi:hypothetical protein
MSEIGARRRPDSLCNLAELSEDENATMGDRYARFAALAAEETLGVHYRIRLADRGTPFVVLAPHGGKIEPGTSQIAAAIARDDDSLYGFEGALSVGVSIFASAKRCARMSMPQQLSLFRPLMTLAEIEALLGPAPTMRALDLLRMSPGDTGVYIHFSHEDGVIYSITYTALVKFPRDVPVCGVRIGMTVDDMHLALPELRLADGATGEPNAQGFVVYHAQPAALNAAIAVSIKDGDVFAIALSRIDMDEVLARRKRRTADREIERERGQARADRWKTIQDPNEMLLAWAKHCSPWTDYSPQRFVAFARWLIATPDPDVWHIVATHWNWDYGRAPLLWIVRQKNCDIATALEVFLLAEPSHYFRYGAAHSSVSVDDLEVLDFLADIRQRLAQSLYERSEIGFDGEERLRVINRALTTAEDKALAQSFFPPEAGQKIPGRDPTGGDGVAARKCYEMLATVN